MIALVLAAGCVSGHEKPSAFSITPVACPNRGNVTSLNNADGITANSSTYKVAVELMKTELKRARKIYREAVKENGRKSTGVGRSISNFIRTFLANSTVINDTAIRIGNVTYTFVLIRLDDRSCGVSFEPRVARVDGITVHLLPSDYINGTRTYTGPSYSLYSVKLTGRLENETCRLRFPDVVPLIAIPRVHAGDYTLYIYGSKPDGRGQCGNVGNVNFRFLSAGGEDVTVYIVLVKENGRR